jgi:hypothetical protein
MQAYIDACTKGLTDKIDIALRGDGDVSTITMTVEMHCEIDTEELGMRCRNNEFKLKPTTKGEFKNCKECMFKVPMIHNGKVKSVKVFKNGKLHITGVQSR